MKEFLKICAVLIGIGIIAVFFLDYQEQKKEEKEKALKQAAAQESVDKKQQFFNLAKKSDVHITDFNQSDQIVTLDVWAHDKNNLGNFLDLLLAKGVIRDIEIDKFKYFSYYLGDDGRRRVRQIMVFRI